MKYMPVFQLPEVRLYRPGTLHPLFNSFWHCQFASWQLNPEPISRKVLMIRQWKSSTTRCCGCHCSLCYSFSYPFYFKFGLGRGALVIGFVQFVLMILGYLGYRMLKTRLNIEEYAQGILEWLSNQNGLALLTGFIGLFLAILGGSIWLSSSFYSNKDI